MGGSSVGALGSANSVNLAPAQGKLRGFVPLRSSYSAASRDPYRP